MSTVSASPQTLTDAVAALGAGRDATVGLLLDNRPAFHVADLAAVMLGAVPVSIYATSSAEQVAHVARDADLRAAIATAVQEGNATLSRAEQVKRFALLSDGWEAGGEELTPTLKLKRRAIEAKYAPAIEVLYTEASA